MLLQSFVQIYQKINLNLANISLTTVPVDKREFGSMTLAFNSKRIEEAICLIRKFQEDFSVIFEDDEKDEVYKLNVQFFPLSKKK